MTDNFDWEFYTNYYPDLKNAGINTKEKALNHYHNYGHKENRRTYQIIDTISIDIPKINPCELFCNTKQIHISSGLIMFKKRIEDKFKVTSYYDRKLPSLFFGVYTDEDLNRLNNHQGIKYIIWGGEDANPNLQHSKMTLSEVKLLHNVIHVSISECLYLRLLSQQIPSILIDFNLVNYSVFKPILNKGKQIMIFNGQSSGREHIYGKKIYEKVIQQLPNFSYIFSNSLNCPNENMPTIYAKCFIMLRLTSYDGNANSVQECEAMNIPVVHNQSNYGLKWKTIDDVIKHIIHHSPK